MLRALWGGVEFETIQKACNWVQWEQNQTISIFMICREANWVCPEMSKIILKIYLTMHGQILSFNYNMHKEGTPCFLTCIGQMWLWSGLAVGVFVSNIYLNCCFFEC